MVVPPLEDDASRSAVADFDSGTAQAVLVHDRRNTASGPLRELARATSSVRRRVAIVNEVGGEQGHWEAEQAEDEVADEAVPLSTGHASRPKGKRDPDGQEGDADKHPAER